jgi:hypothetical protein
MTPFHNNNPREPATMSIRASILALAVLLSPLAASPALSAERMSDALVMSSTAFLDAHPDMKFRQLGLKAWEKGDYEEAFKLFKRAARYADKPSQGMVAEMLWRGEGTAQNRPEAYAWMDLAAERQYRPMLIQREIFWEALSPQERDAAIAVGEALYREYGDAAAQPRLELKMRQAKKMSAGSRTGFVGNVTISIPTPGGTFTIDGTNFYHADYWEPANYWAWQEKGWKNPPRGMVDIGPLSAAPAEPKPAEGQDK